MRASPMLVQRLATLAALGCAFLVMASVFSPGRTRAGSSAALSMGAPTDSPSLTHAQRESGAAWSSKQAHESLRSLGSFESLHSVAHVYATESGARYSIYRKADGAELGALLTLQQAHLLVPELQLPTAAMAPKAAFDDGAAPAIMLADPVNGPWEP